MTARRILYAQLVVVILITVLHLKGIQSDLYWRYLWLDTLTHALGGVWAGLFFMWVRALLRYEQNLAWGIAGALTLGILWELFEIAAGIQMEANYPLDTSIDLFMDVVGGSLGAFLAMRLGKSRGSPEEVL